jgi:2-polyprenyl-3-methyl-5-hydroxy-6-metoxy-1,4-benzoquinol methylase
VSNSSGDLQGDGFIEINWKLEVSTGIKKERASRMTGKVNSVRELFRRTDWYVKGWRTPIAIRTKIVRDFVGAQTPLSILDIGCGDGSVTIPLLSSSNHLTLLDLSDKMLEIAKINVPPDLLDRVKFVNEDVCRAPLSPRSYDLIVCVGVLAHVESPEALIARVCQLAAPGGTIVVECSDAHHFLTKLTGIRSTVVGILRPPTYALNKIRPSWVVNEFAKLNCTLTASYRHTFSIPLVSKLIAANRTYAAIHAIFGDGLSNRNSWLGNQCIFSFRHTEA